MCVPPMAIMGAQMIMGLAAQKQQTAAQTAMYENQARLAEYNARLSERKAETIADNYAKQQRDLNNRMRLVAGQNRAEAGASNLDMAGSQLSLLASSFDAYNQDSVQLLQNQRNDVDAQAVQTGNYYSQAAGARASIANAKKAGRMQMLGTLLSGAASMAGYMNDYQKVSEPSQPTWVHDHMVANNYSQYGYQGAADMSNTGFSNYYRSGNYGFSTYNDYAKKKW